MIYIGQKFQSFNNIPVTFRERKKDNLKMCLRAEMAKINVFIFPWKRFINFYQ